jgi:hypothetical protein
LLLLLLAWAPLLLQTCPCRHLLLLLLTWLLAPLPWVEGA